MPGNGEVEVPQESQTIAAIRSVRQADKLEQARRSSRIIKEWWANAAVEIISVAGIVLLNVIPVWQFMGTATPPTVFSGPVLPLFAKGLTLLGFEFNYGLQVVNVLAYLGFGVALYLLVRYVSGRKIVGILAVLAASLPWGVWGSARIRGAFIGQDSPHIASLTLIILAIWSALRFLRLGGMGNLLVNVGIMSLVVLVSPMGFGSLLLYLAITVFSEMLVGRGRIKIARAILSVVLVYGLVAFWYTPGFTYWLVMGPLGADLRQILGKLLPISMFALPVLAIFGYLLFDRKPGLQPVFLALFYSMSFAGVSLAGGIETSRFAPELGIGASMLLAIVFIRIMDRLKRLGRTVGMGVGAVALVAAILWLGIGQYYDQPDRVLGLWTNVEKDHFWQKRDEFLASPNSYLGTVISSLTVIAISAMVLAKFRKLPA